MSRFSTLSFFSLALIALFFVCLVPVAEAAPTGKPRVPSFAVYSKNNLKGKVQTVSNYGCHNLKLPAVSSVRHLSDPNVNIKFYKDKSCKGKVVHQMDSST
ncbi:hypothetical protein BX616_001484, partial [Lobosporangium transversale]